jgi:hypothetical protein
MRLARENTGGSTGAAMKTCKLKLVKVMTTTLRKTLIALAGATLITTSASAGNLVTPEQEPEVDVVPVFDDPQTGSLGGNTVALGLLGLLVLGGIAAGGGS